jgi:hypothetical protein
MRVEKMSQLLRLFDDRHSAMAGKHPPTSECRAHQVCWRMSSLSVSSTKVKGKQRVGMTKTRGDSKRGPGQRTRKRAQNAKARSS